MRAISRITGVSITTVSKLLVEAGQVCERYHDEHVRQVRASRIEADEIWSFNYAKAHNLPRAINPPECAGTGWTWIAIDPDSKLIVSWLLGDRDIECALVFLQDLYSRLANRVQLTTDGHLAYQDAVERVFGTNVDYSQIKRIYGTGKKNTTLYLPGIPNPKGRERYVTSIKQPLIGRPNPKYVSTSIVERQNLTLRMCVRRYGRKVNAFSKKLENHRYASALYACYYNFIRPHKTLGTTPAVAAGLATRPLTYEELVEMIEAARPAPRRPRFYYGTKRLQRRRRRKLDIKLRGPFPPRRRTRGEENSK